MSVRNPNTRSPGFAALPRAPLQLAEDVYGVVAGTEIVPRQHFVPQPGIPNASSPFGGSPETPARIAAATARSIGTNKVALLSGILDDLTGANAPRWTEFVVDRPSIFRPIDVTHGSVYFHPNKPALSLDQAQRGTSNGTCFLHGAGSWWIKYQRAVAGADPEVLRALIIDAFDPGVVAEYLGERGPSSFDDAQRASITVVPNAIIMLPRRESTFRQIQNTGAARIRVLQQNAQANIVMDGSKGWLLAPLGIWSTQGDSMFRGQVDVGLDASAGGNSSIEWVDYDRA